MAGNPQDLMRMHVEALFTHDVRGDMERVNETNGARAPRFFLGRTRAGHVWRFRSDIPHALRLELSAVCREEPVRRIPTAAPLHADRYLDLLAAHHPPARTWTGPAYYASRVATASADSMMVTADTAHVLEGAMGDWLPDVAEQRPLAAIIEGGKAVAVCASVRITTEAHEAGVETVAARRRRGHASNAVAGWINAMRQSSVTPLYSTSWDNLASQNVARSLDLVMFGVDFHIT